MHTRASFHWRVLPLSDKRLPSANLRPSPKRLSAGKARLFGARTAGAGSLRGSIWRFGNLAAASWFWRAPPLLRWWHEQATRADDPMGPLQDWLRKEPPSRPLR